MIRRIAVLGAGAVGSYFLGGWEHMEDGEVWAVADGERKARLEQEGLIINQEKAALKVKTPEESKGVDLLLVCLKYGALPKALDIIETIADEHTILMCPMNGVNTEDIIAERMGKERILHSMIVISAERVGNAIHYNEGANLCYHYGRAEGYGTVKDRDGQDALEAVMELFARTGLQSKYREDIIAAIWNKFALNIATNIAQAIIGCNYGAYKTSTFMNSLGEKLCAELLEIARAKGINCTFDFQESLRSVGTNDTARFSTLQDLMAGRHTEIDMFCGQVVRMGQELGIPTPFNEFAWLAIKALEEKNDGMIF